MLVVQVSLIRPTVCVMMSLCILRCVVRCRVWAAAIGALSCVRAAVVTIAGVIVAMAVGGAGRLTVRVVFVLLTRRFVFRVFVVVVSTT